MEEALVRPETGTDHVLQVPGEMVQIQHCDRDAGGEREAWKPQGKGVAGGRTARPAPEVARGRTGGQPGGEGRPRRLAWLPPLQGLVP